MNSSKRLFLGVLSCLLLSVGLANAADRIDSIMQPVSLASKNLNKETGLKDGPILTCVIACNVYSPSQSK
ncbi:MAG: hypothetical protein HY302_04405 [Opitutae bacterium]|nr:hypothetical protein [Opitutae bacterium]